MQTSSRSIWIPLTLCAALVFAIAPVAGADTLQIAIGTTTNVVATSTTGAVTYAATLGGWVLTVSSDSNSPGASPFLLGLNVTADCTSSICAGTTLDVFASDTGYSTPVPAGGFTMTDSGSAAGGTTSAIGWAASSNTEFALGGSNLIGTLGPFGTSPFSGSVPGGAAESSPYSVTIEEAFTDGGSGSAVLSADAQVTATPEPEALGLCSSALVLLPFALRRKRKAD